MAAAGDGPVLPERSVNEGFSGGEKKRNEILQMAVLEPTLAILDETDSGLDIDALQDRGGRREQAPGGGPGDVRPAHHALPAPPDYIVPDKVHVLSAAASFTPADRSWRSSWSSAATPGSRTGRAAGARAQRTHERRRHLAGRVSRAGRGPAGCRPPWQAAGDPPARHRSLRRRRLADPRSDSFRHTSRRSSRTSRFTRRGRNGERPEAALGQLRRDGEAGHWLVFVDGVFAPALSGVGALPAGVGALSDALERFHERVEAAIGSAEAGASPAALNAAFAADGAFVHLARGVAVEAPIHLVFVADAAGASHPRTALIVAGAGA